MIREAQAKKFLAESLHRSSMNQISKFGCRAFKNENHAAVIS
jgi:hypothetical protein